MAPKVERYHAGVTGGRELVDSDTVLCQRVFLCLVLSLPELSEADQPINACAFGIGAGRGSSLLLFSL